MAIRKLPVQRRAAHAGVFHHEFKGSVHAVRGENGIGSIKQLCAAGLRIRAFGGRRHCGKLSDNFVR